MYWSLEPRKGQPNYDIIKDGAAINQWHSKTGKGLMHTGAVLSPSSAGN